MTKQRVIKPIENYNL